MSEFVNQTVSMQLEKSTDGGWLVYAQAQGVPASLPSSRAGLKPEPTSPGGTQAKTQHPSSQLRLGKGLGRPVSTHKIGLSLGPGLGPPGGQATFRVPARPHPRLLPALGSLLPQPSSVPSGARPEVPIKPSAWGEPQPPPPGSFSFFFFTSAPMPYRSSQARGQIGAAAACLHHSHSNTRSKLRLRPTPQFTATPDL